VSLRELLPPDPALSSRRQARAKKRRHSGPVVAGLVIVAAATTGSLAALLSNDPVPSGTTVAGYPSASAAGSTPVSPAKASTAAPGSRPSSSVPASRAGASSAADDAEGDAQDPEAQAPATDASGALLMPSGTPYIGPRWPALTYTLKATSNGMAPAPFPKVVPGYVLKDSFTTRLTVTETTKFAVFGDLPVRTASYNVCRQQRFFVRWLAIDAKAVVESSFVDAQVRTVQNRPVRGAGGWQSSFGCVQPALRIRPPAVSGPKRTVVVAQMQVWVRK
jgi:hypothetical protein